MLYQLLLYNVIFLCVACVFLFYNIFIVDTLTFLILLQGTTLSSSSYLQGNYSIIEHTQLSKEHCKNTISVVYILITPVFVLQLCMFDNLVTTLIGKWTLPAWRPNFFDEGSIIFSFIIARNSIGHDLYHNKTISYVFNCWKVSGDHKIYHTKNNDVTQIRYQ